MTKIGIERVNYPSNELWKSFVEEMVCPKWVEIIDMHVLEKPVILPCGHVVCKSCVPCMLGCPAKNCIGRRPLSDEDMTVVSIPLRNMLNKLEIKCEFAGCKTVSLLSGLADHVKFCLHNGQRHVKCVKGCGLSYPNWEEKEHLCVPALRKELDEARRLLSRVSGHDLY